LGIGKSVDLDAFEPCRLEACDTAEQRSALLRLLWRGRARLEFAHRLGARKWDWRRDAAKTRRRRRLRYVQMYAWQDGI